MKQTKARRDPVTRDEFLKIVKHARRVSDGQETITEVADRFNRSRATVREIFQAGTFPQYERNKVSRRQSSGTVTDKKARRNKSEQTVAHDIHADDVPSEAEVLNKVINNLCIEVDNLKAERLASLTMVRSRLDDIQLENERIQSWLKAIDTRLSNLNAKALKWPWGRR